MQNPVRLPRSPAEVKMGKFKLKLNDEQSMEGHSSLIQKPDSQAPSPMHAPKLLKLRGEGECPRMPEHIGNKMGAKRRRKIDSLIRTLGCGNIS